MCFLPLKSSHYPSRPVPIPEFFGKYPTRPVPKSKTPTRRALMMTFDLRKFNFTSTSHVTGVQWSARLPRRRGRGVLALVPEGCQRLLSGGDEKLVEHPRRADLL